MSEEKPNVPKLRFPGFADPWEQRKFSEIATLRRGLTYSPNDITDKNGGIRVLRSSNISGDQFELHDDDVFVREDAVKIAPAEDGDILITAANGSSNLVGKRARICNLPGKTVHGGFMLLASTGDSYYLNAAMGAQWYRRFLHMGVAGGNGALGNLDMKALLDYELLTPSRNERKKIGSLFNRLDSLITLHQRKLDHLKEMKKGLLQKMFPKNGESIPELRFPGFADPWEQRKLGEIAHRIIRKNGGNQSNLPLTISAQYGLVDQRDYFNNQVASRDMSGYYLLQNGEFAYNKSTSGDSPWGAVKRLTKYENGCVSTLYICFGLDEGDSDFLVTYYETDRWHKEVRMIAAEGARNHGLLNIAPSDFFETELTMPAEIEEQAQIGAFFQQLDSLITLHQRKLDHLKQMKKGLLQQMFV